MLDSARLAGVVEQRYAYGRGSRIAPKAGGLSLATSGGSAPGATLFRGTMRRPDLVADALLVLATVARTRFHVPPAMLTRILIAADPIVTVSDDRLRFESFSADCGVYARLDLLPKAVEGEVLGRGTTNVDIGPELRSALARIDAGAALGIEVGVDAVTVRSERREVRERRVALPARWVRGLGEVGAIQSSLANHATLDAPQATRLLRMAVQLPTNRPAWLTGGATARVVHHAADGAAAVGGIGRLRVLQRMLRHVRGLQIHAGGDGTSGWVVELDDGRLTLVISPEAWRGFSGEGRQLEALAVPEQSLVGRIRGELRWQATVDLAALAGRLGVDVSRVRTALTVLAASGSVGYDLDAGAYFHRQLPYDLENVERDQPRLVNARGLVAAGAVRVEDTSEHHVDAWVRSGAVDHHVRVDEVTWTCTCPWYARHRVQRGPCKHVLAVQILSAGAEG